MAALRHFSGKTVRGGFSMTNPTLGGFGEWIEQNSSRYGRSLTPRHGSFIACMHRSEIELPILLLELCNSRALNRKGKYYYANEELFQKMLELSEQALTIASPKI
jgi:hypothetical protein